MGAEADGVPVLTAAVRAFINRMQDEATEVIAACTVSLHGVQDDEPKQNGTGVLLKIADAGLLLSAAHVLACATVHKIPHLIGGATGGAKMIPLHGVDVHSAGDPFDLAVIRLPPATVEELEEHKKFLRLSQIDPVVRRERGNYNFVYGFPYALAATDLKKRVARVTSFRYGTNAFHDAAVEIKDFDNDRDVVLAMPRQGNIDSDGNPADLPRLGGISGCGMWRLCGPDVKPSRWTVDDIRLIGIEHRVLHGTYIRGTRIAIMNRLIWDNFPDLRAPMDVGFSSLAYR